MRTIHAASAAWTQEPEPGNVKQARDLYFRKKEV